MLDAASDRRFTNDELVTGPPAARLYVGAPIIVRPGTAHGIFIGTLCILDPTPRDAFALSEAAALQTRAKEVAKLLEGVLHASEWRTRSPAITVMLGLSEGAADTFELARAQEMWGERCGEKRGAAGASSPSSSSGTGGAAPP